MWFKNDIVTIEKELDARIERAENALTAWNAVEIRTKKDGNEYKELGRAINGGRLERDKWDNTPSDIVIHYSTIRSGWQSDSLQVYGFLDELPDEDPRKAAYVRQFIRQRYTLTAAEVRKQIDSRRAYYRKRIELLKEEREAARTLYAQYHEAVKAAEQALSAALPTEKDYQRRDLYNLITEAR